MSFEPIRICHAVITQHGPLLATLFVAGLVGSATHCAGMCGPFVLSQTAVALDELPLKEVSTLARLRGGALIPYHFGRMTTYAGLGVAASLLSAQLRGQGWFHILTAVLLMGAGLLFLVSAIPALGVSLPPVSSKIPEAFLTPLRSLFAHPRGLRGYALGLALGFLPCGLVYAALLSVASRGEPLTAALGMIVFALGTVPALVAVGIGGQFAFHRFRNALRLVFPVLMLINSLALFVMAGESIR